VPDSVGFGCGFGIRHIPSFRYHTDVIEDKHNRAETKEKVLTEEELVLWFLT